MKPPGTNYAHVALESAYKAYGFIGARRVAFVVIFFVQGQFLIAAPQKYGSGIKIIEY
ncbi:hypothetical protein [Paenibacillus lactis]|uniref:hypothetical protein n=1 Tax=Paenibacillus lactis TaxID=228574 RepID=UPI0016436A39